jgi:hypothetical protein
MKTWQPRPTRALNLGENTSGVFPSPSEMTALHGGRNSPNRLITPPSCFIFASFIRNFHSKSIRAIVEPQLQL